MGIVHTKNLARVLARADVPLFIMGVHGIGKTSAIYQLYQEGASERGVAALPKEIVAKVLLNSKVVDADEAEIDLDLKVLSSLDGKHLARASASLEEYGFWSMSAPNISIEEIIGMPHVEDRGAIYREALYRAHDTAGNLMVARSKGMKHEEMIKEHEELTQLIFEGLCKKLGITERDRNDLVLRYLRMHALMPDPRHTGGGIWLIDELNRGFQEVEKAMMQILLERRYLDYIVPDGIWICTTMNPPGGEYQVREMDAATLDRGAMVTITSEKTEWLSWAAKRGLSEGSRIFVDKHSKFVNTAEASFNAAEHQNPATFRSVEYCDKAFSVMTEAEIKDVGLSVASSLLGMEAGVIYHREATETIHRALTAKEITEKFGWKKTMTQEEEQDYKKWKPTAPRKRLKTMIQRTNVKTELINYSISELTEYVEQLDKDLKERGSTKTNPKHTKEERGAILNIFLFLHDIPIDLSRHFIMDVIDDKFYRLMFWAGHYPVCKSLYDRIETEYQDAAKGDDDG